MENKGIWPNLSQDGAAVTLMDVSGKGYCSCSKRNGKCYAWVCDITGIVRELIHNCISEDDAVSKTRQVVCR